MGKVSMELVRGIARGTTWRHSRARPRRRLNLRRKNLREMLLACPVIGIRAPLICILRTI